MLQGAKEDAGRSIGKLFLELRMGSNGEVVRNDDTGFMLKRERTGYDDGIEELGIEASRMMPMFLD